MVGGTQALDAVLELARGLAGNYGEAFDVPVLVIEGDDDADGEDSTEVTIPSDLRPASPPSVEESGPGLVIPLQPRFPAAGPVKLSFGRSSVCDLVLPFASVSKHHGNFIREGELWLLSDVGSRNGTLIRGVKIGEAPVPIPDGANLEIGKIPVRFFSVRAFHQFLTLKLGFG